MSDPPGGSVQDSFLGWQTPFVLLLSPPTGLAQQPVLAGQINDDHFGPNRGCDPLYGRRDPVDFWYFPGPHRQDQSNSGRIL